MTDLLIKHIVERLERIYSRDCIRKFKKENKDPIRAEQDEFWVCGTKSGTAEWITNRGKKYTVTMDKDGRLVGHQTSISLQPINLDRNDLKILLAHNNQNLCLQMLQNTHPLLPEQIGQTLTLDMIYKYTTIDECFGKQNTEKKIQTLYRKYSKQLTAKENELFYHMYIGSDFSVFFSNYGKILWLNVPEYVGTLEGHGFRNLQKHIPDKYIRVLFSIDDIEFFNKVLTFIDIVV